MEPVSQAIAKHKKGFGIAAAFLLLAVITFSYFKTPDFSDLTGQLTGDLGNASGKIVLAHPQGGEVFSTGDIITIKWVNLRLSNADQRIPKSLQIPVSLYLETKQGDSLTEIAKNITDNSYAYPVPADLNGFYRIALSSAEGKAVSGVFTISP